MFVQSIRTGAPVAGARVELVGSNGQPVLAATTDAAGRAHLPAPPRNASREKTPQMIVVEKDGDMSFMPFRTGGRELDLSRFDTGGVENAAVGAAAVRVPVLRSRHLSARRDDASRRDRADRRLEGVARPACRSTSRSPIRAALVVSRTAVEAVGRRLR